MHAHFALGLIRRINHSNHTEHSQFQEQPHFYNSLGPMLEYVVLQIVLSLMKWVPKVIITRILARITGMPTIIPTHQVIPLEDTLKLIDALQEKEIPIGIGLCPCRHAQGKYVKSANHAKSKKFGEKFNIGDEFNYTDMVIGKWGLSYVTKYPESFKLIRYTTARRLLSKFDQMGFVHVVFNSCPSAHMQGVICNCDTRVCVPFQFFNALHLKSFWNAPYILHYDTTICTGCGNCVSICPVHARTYDSLKKRIKFDETICIRCGLCRAQCPAHANILIPNPSANRWY